MCAVKSSPATGPCTLPAITDGGGFEQTILENLRTAGIQNGRKAERLEFDLVESYAGTPLQAVGIRDEAPEGAPKRIGVSIGPQYGTVAPSFVRNAAREASRDKDLDPLCLMNTNWLVCDGARLRGRVVGGSSGSVMKARAAVLRGGRDPFTIEELAVSEPQAGEVAVRMVATGMCHTDILVRELPPEFFMGPQVYGHEGAGVVESIGEGVSHVAAGDHVVLSFNNCDDCPACNQGRLPYCFNFQIANTAGGRADGTSAFTDSKGDRVGSHYFGQSSFASHTIAAANSVVRVDSSFDLARLGPLGCGVQTGAGAVFNTLGVEAGSSLVVAGAGALGLSAIMAAKVADAGIIIAIDRHESRLELATKYGATHVLTGDTTEMTAAIIEATGGGADYAFDATGAAPVVRAVVNGLNNIGTCALAGVGFGELVIDYMTMIGGRTVTGVMEGDSTPSEFIPRLAQLNASGAFPFHELIVDFPLDQINAAEAASANGSVVKPVIRF